MSTLDPLIYGCILIGRRSMPALFLATYLMMGSAKVSSAGWQHLDGGVPWPRWRLAAFGLYPYYGGRISVGVSLKWSGEVGDPYPWFCWDRGSLEEGSWWWGLYSEAGRRWQRPQTTLQRRGAAKRNRGDLLMLTVGSVDLGRRRRSMEIVMRQS
jgi:hypothetical protein